MFGCARHARPKMVDHVVSQRWAIDLEDGTYYVTCVADRDCQEAIDLLKLRIPYTKQELKLVVVTPEGK